MLQDHPLVTYMEDPFADSDITGYLKLKEALTTANLGYVRIGMRHMFKDSSLIKVQEITTIRPLTAEEKKAESDAAEEEAKRPPTNEKDTKPGRGAAAAS